MSMKYDAYRDYMNQNGPDWCEHGMDSRCPECRALHAERLLKKTEAEAAAMQELLFAVLDHTVPAETRWFLLPEDLGRQLRAWGAKYGK